MQIEAGKHYLTRSGEVVGPMEPTRFGNWRGWDGGRLLFEMDGRHGDESDAENHLVPNEPANDIVSPAPGSAGQNVALDWADELIAANHKRLRLEAAAPQMLEALRKLAAQCRAEFSVDGKWSNDGQLVTQAAVKAAESAIAAATGELTS